MTGQVLKLAGQATVTARVGKVIRRLTVYVAEDSNCPVLFGRDWISAFFGRNWVKRLTKNTIASVSENKPAKLAEILEKYKNTVFKPGLGELKVITAQLQLKQDAQPRFFKPRVVPSAVKPKLEKALEAMVEEGNLERVEYSRWGTPVVPVVKPDGTVRVCGDYKVTLNPSLEVPQYPLPRVEECFQAMNGGHYYTKIDLAQAYNQVTLDEESKELTTINTHKGLYRWTRLPYSVASSPAIFQEIMDKVLQGLHHVVWYLDDILITGESEEQHLDNIEQVLGRLEMYGLRARESKCKFFEESVEYLGHLIDKEGVHPLEKKVTAILEAKPPKNVEELQSFMGMVNYYAKFIPNMSTITAPLNELNKKGVAWKWKHKEKEAFRELKEKLASTQVLIHYNPNLPLKLDCDASSVGLGAVLSHVMKDGTERPIAYASRSLSKAERNYSQIEKEALSIVWALHKFHQYLYLNKFILVTDHKPLTVLFKPDKAIPVIASGRIQRWALFLMDYRYQIQFRSTTKHGNADTLSRFPLEEEEVPDKEILFVHQLQCEDMYLTDKEIAKSTKKNPLLTKVINYVRSGWPSTVNDELRPYHRLKEELTVEGGCLLRGMQVIIPPGLRKRILVLLHKTHPGIVRMKALARSYVWWPKLDEDLEGIVKTCQECQQNHKEDQKTPLHPLEQPTRPWQRVHLDFAGPFKGQMWLVLVDAYSKWPEVIPMTTTTAPKTIQELRWIFARFGLPESIVTDNGPQFVATEFADFTRRNGIKHVRVAPYHPRSNGQAERFVQTFKDAMKMSEGNGDIYQKLATFLLIYRKTPHTTTTEAPALLLNKRNPRSRLDLIKPDVNRRIKEQQQKQKKYFDIGSQCKEFTSNQPVWVRNYRGTNK